MNKNLFTVALLITLVFGFNVSGQDDGHSDMDKTVEESADTMNSEGDTMNSEGDTMNSEGDTMHDDPIGSMEVEGSMEMEVSEEITEMVPVDESAETASTEAAMAMMPTPEEMAAEYLELLNNQSYQLTWHYQPNDLGKIGFYEGPPPHGNILRTFVNNIAYDAMINKLNPLPVGSIIVKENYTPEKEFAALTIMAKVEDYNPDANDWYFTKVKLDGTVEAAGAPAGCIGCHGGRKDNDWIFNFTLGATNP